jgi:hypothetical protein
MPRKWFTGGGLNIKYRILCVVQNVIGEQEYKMISDTAPTAVQRWTEKGEPMYKSPIDIVYGQMETQLEGHIMKAVQNVHVNVDKDELLRALQYDRGQYKKGYEDGKRDAQKWIPVTERLPEKFTSCIVYRKGSFGGHFSMLRYSPALGWHFYDSEWGDVTVEDVTHWMPLPEPPKGE